MNKKILVVAGLLISLILISNALAITASIGNARMILRAQTGDILEKSILVKNVNNVSVNIVLTASGDLEDNTIIKDKNFTLQPNEDKNAFFTIKVTKAGTTETRINVQFTPIGEKNGAGLSSVITVIANGTDSDENNDDVSAEDNASENNNSSNSIKNVISEIKITKTGVALLITGITFIIFIVVLVIYYVKFNKKKKVILTGDSLIEDSAWEKSRDSLIEELKECDSSDKFLKIISSTALSMKNFKKIKKEKTKLKKKVKKRA